MYGYYKQKHKVFISFYYYDDQKYKVSVKLLA